MSPSAPADRLVTALGERAPPLQIGHSAHDHPVQPPGHAFTHGQHRQQLVIPRARTRNRDQRVDRLDEEAVRGGNAIGGHDSILLAHLFE
jgi:hypothetical protein